MHLRRLIAPVAAAFVAGATTLVGMPATSSADPRGARDASAVVRWNEIAERTIVENAVPVPASSLYFGFAALAAYDAVVTIEGRYASWAAQPRPHAHASSEVAAVTASYHVLRHYFPASANALAADHATSLAAGRAGVGKVHGTRVGEAAAAAVIDARTGDGRGASVPPPGGGATTGAGVWRPTPPANAAMAVPWLGFVQPLVLPSSTAVPWSGPDPLGSAAYAADFAEVRDYGGTTSLRTPEQTATALFWNANPVRQYNAAVRSQVVDRGLDIVDAARTFALHHSSTADALITCWRAKHTTNFWRPVTAIAQADSDGNAATAAVPGWTPLATTPAYPDYASGHACLTGAATGTLEHLFGPSLTPALTVPSFTNPPQPRQYGTTQAVDEETMNARIWLGFHFRKAMTDGNAIGHAVADHAVAHAFTSLT